MEALSSVQCLGGDVELAVGLSTIQCSRVFEVVNKIQIHAPLELSPHWSLLVLTGPLLVLTGPLLVLTGPLLVLTGPLLMFLTVVLSVVVLWRACHPLLHAPPHPPHAPLSSHCSSPCLPRTPHITAPHITTPHIT